MTDRQTMNFQETESLFADRKRKTGNAGSEVLLWVVHLKH